MGPEVVLASGGRTSPTHSTAVAAAPSVSKATGELGPPPPTTKQPRAAVQARHLVAARGTIRPRSRAASLRVTAPSHLLPVGLSPPQATQLTPQDALAQLASLQWQTGKW